MRPVLGELCGTSVRSAVKIFLFAGLTFCGFSFAQSDSSVPPEVRFKSSYVNPTTKPPSFTSAMLWGIGIADTREAGFQHATIEIASTQLVCRANGYDSVLNDDHGTVRGGLYRRYPWFGTDEHEPMPLAYSADRHSVLRVGTRPDKVWHFWAASPRAQLPRGHLEGCTVKMRVRISPGALLQIGFDYWRDTTVEYGTGGNNHEAGAGDWYRPSPAWQELTFSDVPR